jgi:hypothetical protein
MRLEWRGHCYSGDRHIDDKALVDGAVRQGQRRVNAVLSGLPIGVKK